MRSVSPATKLMSAKLCVEWPDGRTSDVAISRILKVKKSEKDLPVNARSCPPVIGDHVFVKWRTNTKYWGIVVAPRTSVPDNVLEFSDNSDAEDDDDDDDEDSSTTDSSNCPKNPETESAAEIEKVIENPSSLVSSSGEPDPRNIILTPISENQSKSRQVHPITFN